MHPGAAVTKPLYSTLLCRPSGGLLCQGCLDFSELRLQRPPLPGDQQLLLLARVLSS